MLKEQLDGSLCLLGYLDESLRMLNHNKSIATELGANFSSDVVVDIRTPSSPLQVGEDK